MKKFSVIFNVDYKGAIKLKSFGIKTILILPPSILELKNRLQKRGEENIVLRMSNIFEEISQSHLFDHILVNDHIEYTVEKIEKIIYKNNNFLEIEKIEELKNDLRKFN